MLRNVPTPEKMGAAELLKRNRCGMTVRITRMKTPHISSRLGSRRIVRRRLRKMCQSRYISERRLSPGNSAGVRLRITG